MDQNTVTVTVKAIAIVIMMHYQRHFYSHRRGGDGGYRTGILCSVIGTTEVTVVTIIGGKEKQRTAPVVVQVAVLHQRHFSIQITM